MLMYQIYIFTRLFNVHDRIAALELCETIDRVIESGGIEQSYKCFLPYRDSNEKVKDKQNKTYEIFKMDCESIVNSDVLVGYLDGPIYDSGIGFELGYAYVLGKKIITMSSDYFLRWFANGERVSVSPLLKSIADVIHIREADVGLEYKMGQLNIRNLLWDKMISKINCKNSPHSVSTAVSRKKYDYYIDASFAKNEPGREILKKIVELFLMYDVSYYVGNENDYINGESLAGLLSECKSVIVYSDGFELNIESAIIQGMSYALNLHIILYATDNIRLYQNEDFILYKNPMIEHSADRIVSSYNDIIH